MKAVVIYESMYGNTHLIADAVADGFRRHGDAVVVPIDEADAALVESADLVVVGGPTHAHGMSHVATRKGAIQDAQKPESELVLDPDADENEGLREWFASLDQVFTNAAAFDTRFNASAALTGRASKGIARKLRHHGATLIAEPESFFVQKDNHLEPEEETHARGSGARGSQCHAPYRGLCRHRVSVHTRGLAPAARCPRRERADVAGASTGLAAGVGQRCTGRARTRGTRDRGAALRGESRPLRRLRRSDLSPHVDSGLRSRRGRVRGRRPDR